MNHKIYKPNNLYANIDFKKIKDELKLSFNLDDFKSIVIIHISDRIKLSVNNFGKIEIFFSDTYDYTQDINIIENTFKKQIKNLFRRANMAKYTEQEEKGLNQQLVRWQKRQLTAVRQNNIDKSYEQMTEIDRSVWEKIANAETHKDVNWLVWEQAERVISKYCNLAR